jgi:hypothetical protein
MKADGKVCSGGMCRRQTHIGLVATPAACPLNAMLYIGSGYFALHSSLAQCRCLAEESCGEFDCFISVYNSLLKDRMSMNACFFIQKSYLPAADRLFEECQDA